MQDAISKAAAEMGRKGGSVRSESKAAAARANGRLGGVRYFWLVLGRDQGQIVTRHQPQIAGRAEGAEGRGKGLRLWTDGSDRTWELHKGKRIVAAGRLADAPAPTVEEAIALAAR